MSPASSSDGSAVAFTVNVLAGLSPVLPAWSDCAACAV
jgi:hypothetical protein